MHIVLNAMLLSGAASYRSAGVSNYSRNLIRALGRMADSTVTQAESHRLTVLTGDDTFTAPGVDLRTTRLPLAYPPARIVWEQSVLPGLLAQLGADLQHGLVNVLPLASGVPGVVTVHDLSFVRLPDKFPPAKRFYLTRLCRASVARAARVIAVSRQTADDLVRYFELPARKIEVVHNGVEARFVPGPAAANQAFRTAKGLPAEFFLFVGTLEPRKNLDLLLRAFARFHARPEHAHIKLVMVGGKGWFFEDIFRQVAELGLEASVLFPGFVEDEELPAWYRAALAFVYPSLFEGFGLPVLEAMACGTPVICSRAGSLLEIVGDAALTAPATDSEGWVAALTLLANQLALRSQLRARGLARAAHFTWEATAAQTWEVYQAAYSAR